MLFVCHFDDIMNTQMKATMAGKSLSYRIGMNAGVKLCPSTVAIGIYRFSQWKVSIFSFGFFVFSGVPLQIFNLPNLLSTNFDFDSFDGIAVIRSIKSSLFKSWIDMFDSHFCLIILRTLRWMGDCHSHKSKNGFSKSQSRQNQCNLISEIECKQMDCARSGERWGEREKERKRDLLREREKDRKEERKLVKQNLL